MRPLSYIFKCIVAVTLLVILFQFVPFEDMTETLSSANPGWFVIGFVMQLLVRCVGTVGLRVIAINQSVQASNIEILRVLLTTEFYSLFLPGTLATGGVTWLKYRALGARGESAAAIIVINRAVNFMLMFGIGSIAFVADQLREQLNLTGIVLFAVVGGIATLVLVPPWAIPMPQSTTSRLFPVYRVKRFLYKLALPLELPRAQKVIVVLAALVHELLAAGVIWCFARTVGLEFAFITAVWMRCVLQVALLLPITVAGLGLREVSLVGVGVMVGILPAVATAWSLTIFAGTVCIALLGGVAEFIGNPRRA